MPNLNHRLFTAVLVFCASPTFAATTCAPGYWLDNDICTECGDAQYYCPGDNIRHSVTRGYYSTGGTQTTRTGQTQCVGFVYCENGIKYDCPDPQTHVRTTFPDNYYNPTIFNFYEPTGTRGNYSLADCRAENWMKSSRGLLVDRLWFNPDTDIYDIVRYHAWYQVEPGYYLAGPRNSCLGGGGYAYYDTILDCPENAYCPGKKGVPCTDPNVDAEYTETFGLYTCPDTHPYSPSVNPDINGCYQTCNEYDISNGQNIPTSNATYYPNECTYNTICDTGYASPFPSVCGALCTNGITALRTGNGTNVPLYQEKMSVPALNIQLESGQVCYGALATGVGKLNIEYNNQIYHAIE